MQCSSAYSQNKIVVDLSLFSYLRTKRKLIYKLHFYTILVGGSSSDWTDNLLSIETRFQKFSYHRIPVTYTVYSTSSQITEV